MLAGVRDHVDVRVQRRRHPLLEMRGEHLLRGLLMLVLVCGPRLEVELLSSLLRLRQDGAGQQLAAMLQHAVERRRRKVGRRRGEGDGGDGAQARHEEHARAVHLRQSLAHHESAVAARGREERERAAGTVRPRRREQTTRCETAAGGMRCVGERGMAWCAREASSSSRRFRAGAASHWLDA